MKIFRRIINRIESPLHPRRLCCCDCCCCCMAKLWQQLVSWTSSSSPKPISGAPKCLLGNQQQDAVNASHCSFKHSDYCLPSRSKTPIIHSAGASRSCGGCAAFVSSEQEVPVQQQHSYLYPGWCHWRSGSAISPQLPRQWSPSGGTSGRRPRRLPDPAPGRLRARRWSGRLPIRESLPSARHQTVCPKDQSNKAPAFYELHIVCWTLQRSHDYAVCLPHMHAAYTEGQEQEQRFFIFHVL